MKGSGLLTSDLLYDLKWLLGFETIHQTIDLTVYLIDDWEEVFQCLVANPQKLEEVFSHIKSHFLGSYFEVLFSFMVRHFTTLEIVSEHEQIQTESRTLGEVDLIVRTPKGDLIQLEIAVKFYLERPDLAPDNWIGPNKNDSLRKKTEHAFQHQLKILKTKEGVRWLDSRSIPLVQQAELLIFGRKFYDFSVPNCNHKAGWVSFDGFLSSRWPALAEAHKPHWLSHLPSMQFYEHSIWCRLLKVRFELDPRPVLFAVSAENAKKLGNTWLFVVPTGW